MPFKGQPGYGDPVLTTMKVAELAGCSRYTVERAIRDNDLKAEKAGRTWTIDDAEGQRWAALYTPYSGLKKRRPRKKQEGATGWDGQAGSN